MLKVIVVVFHVLSIPLPQARSPTWFQGAPELDVWRHRLIELPAGVVDLGGNGGVKRRYGDSDAVEGGRVTFTLIRFVL